MQGERSDTLTTFKKNGNYATGELFVTRTTDEDGNRSFEFTDKLGRKVLSRRMNGNEKLDIYYLYNEFDELLAVLPPVTADYFTESTSTTWTTANCDILNKQAYLYKYDYWHRVHGRKLPGAAWEIQVRDTYGRITFTQNGEQRKRNEWSFAINDAFNRPCLTGVCYNTDISMATLQANTATLKRNNTNSTLKGYTLTGITLTNPVVHTVNYYDDYSFIGQSTIAEFNSTAYNYEAETGYGTQNGGAKGMLTGTLTATLNGSTVTGYQPSVMYYDYRGRPVQTRSGNHLGGVEKEWLALDFTGNVMKRKHVHTATGETTRTEVYTYTYDHAGRLLTVKHSLDGGMETTLTANEYDELGRLESITHNGKASLKTGYSYNVRDWMTGMTNPLYSQTLTYGYGGNINTQQWVQDSKTHKYTYTYDGLNRLTHAAYTGDGNYTTNYTYDKNGNIKTLQRYDVSLVDNLTLTYNGNQLTKVEDSSSNAFGFANGSTAATEYYYDNNGNLTKDSNKGITNISYNSLSLPSVVTFGDGSTITYTYAADGRKLKTVHVIGNTTTQTDYCGNVIYENGTARLLLTEAGYVDLTDNSHHFYIKDHLGNNRVVADANGTVEESNQYYPFGLSYANANSNVQPYKYNGKELDSKAGLNWYDYGARHYDAALGRWFVVDPLAEKMYGWSPYGYCFNNPVKFVDEDGMAPDPGDLFATPRAAAKDWGWYYNGYSIVKKHEMGSSIYEVKDKNNKLIGYSYTSANVGKAHSTGFSKPKNGEKVVATIHSHGNYDGIVKNDDGSMLKVVDNEFSSADKTYNNQNKRLGYLTTPNGSLLEHNPNTNAVTVITDNLPSDKNDPNRKNKTNATETPKDVPLLERIKDWLIELF